MKPIDEIKTIAPDLLRYLDKGYTDIPDNYFINMQDQVWRRLELPEKAPPSPAYFEVLGSRLSNKVSAGRRVAMYQKVGGLAAAMLVLIAAIITFLPGQNKPGHEVSDSELALYYFEDNIDRWSPELMAEYELIEEENLQDLYSTEEDVLASYLDYLDPEDINLETLEEIQ